MFQVKGEGSRVGVGSPERGKPGEKEKLQGLGG